MGRRHSLRLVTGEADSKRRLYTDDEDVIIELRRAVLLNGINVPTDRGDVLDRALVVELERIPDGDARPRKSSGSASRPSIRSCLVRSSTYSLRQ